MIVIISFQIHFVIISKTLYEQGNQITEVELPEKNKSDTRNRSVIPVGLPCDNPQAYGAPE